MVYSMVHVCIVAVINYVDIRCILTGLVLGTVDEVMHLAFAVCRISIRNRRLLKTIDVSELHVHEVGLSVCSGRQSRYSMAASCRLIDNTKIVYGKDRVLYRLRRILIVNFLDLEAAGQAAAAAAMLVNHSRNNSHGGICIGNLNAGNRNFVPAVGFRKFSCSLHNDRLIGYRIGNSVLQSREGKAMASFCSGKRHSREIGKRLIIDQDASGDV